MFSMITHAWKTRGNGPANTLTGFMVKSPDCNVQCLHSIFQPRGVHVIFLCAGTD